MLVVQVPQSRKPSSLELFAVDALSAGTRAGDKVAALRIGCVLRFRRVCIWHASNYVYIYIHTYIDLYMYMSVYIYIYS